MSKKIHYSVLYLKLNFSKWEGRTFPKQVDIVLIFTVQTFSLADGEFKNGSSEARSNILLCGSYSSVTRPSLNSFAAAGSSVTCCKTTWLANSKITSAGTENYQLYCWHESSSIVYSVVHLSYSLPCYSKVIVLWDVYDTRLRRDARK